MKNMKLKILVALFLTMMAFASSAQILKSVYFVDGVPTRHQLNPAFAPRSGYIGIPALGNFGLSVNSNVGLGTFLYPNKDNEFNSFLHKDVSSSDFLDKLNRNNVLDANLNLNIIQFGFHAGKNSFTSFDINVKSNTYTTLPKELFSFLKTGMSNPTGNYYDFSDVGVNTQNYIDVALGHSRQINKKLRVGIKLKALLGVVNAYTHFDHLNVTMSQDEWIIRGKGELISSGLKFETEEKVNDKGETVSEVTGAEMGDIGLNGLGFAFDAGATYKLKDNLELSLAVLDLGYMNWDKSVKGYMDGEPIRFSGFDDLSISDDEKDKDNSFDDQMDDLTDDVEALFTFYEMKDVGNIKNRQTTNPTLNVGAEYSLFNDKFSVGLLSSTLFRKKFTISDAMLSANYSPAKWFALTAHTSISNIGWTWGGLLNLSPRVFNFFVGATVVSSKLSPQYIPVNEAILNVNFGFNVLFGHKDKRKKKAAEEEIVYTVVAPVVKDTVQKDTVVEPVTTVDPVAPIKQEEVKEIDSDTLSNSYYVIVGSFKSKGKAEELQKKLDVMGFKESVILVNELGMYRVSANSYSTHSACWEEVFEMRKKFPQFIKAWGLLAEA